MIQYKCAKCGGDMTSPDSLAGTTDFCPDCGNANNVPEKAARPAPASAAPASVSSERPAPAGAGSSSTPQATPASDFVMVPCPKCGVPLRLKGAAAGARARCGACQTRFGLVASPGGQLVGQTDAGDTEAPSAAPRAAPAPPAQRAPPAGPGRAPAPGAASASASSERQALKRPASARAGAPAAPAAVAIDVNSIIAALARALSWRKIAVYGLITLASVVVSVVLMFAAGLTRNGEIMTVASLLVLVLSFGMTGVAAGAISRMAHAENEGRGERFGEGLTFALRRFHSLFGAALLLGVALLLVLGMVNGLPYLLNHFVPKVGSLISAVLYLPQYVINLAACVCVPAAMLMFCAIAVENIGAFRAVGRLGTCLLRRGSETVIQVILVAVFGLVVVLFLAVLLQGAALLTDVTNGPVVSKNVFGRMADVLEDPSALRNDSPFGISARGNSGDWLRQIWKALILLVVMTYPTVYAVVAFTNFYERIRKQLVRQ